MTEDLASTEHRWSTAPHDDGSPITHYLKRLRKTLADDMSGDVASYIPELAHADPKSFGIALMTVDGKLYEVGESRLPHTIQSMSKPFTYGLALMEHGRERVLDQVGVEPTGDEFNSIILDEDKNRPFNPMVNAGAIAVAELLPGNSDDERVHNLLGFFSDIVGRDLTIDTKVYESERDTGHRNRAIAYMMLNTGMIERDPEAVLDTYFRQCSVVVDATDMAAMAAMLANHGVSPLTGQRIYSPEVVRDVLTLMSTCGMYNYAGQWAYEVGIPAKSGVSGGVIAVIPGQLGIAIYSPPLDENGNSIRGVNVCKALSQDFSLHAYSDRTNVHTVIRREYRANMVNSKRMRPNHHCEAMKEQGHRIGVIEVQGALYFGSAEILTRRMSALLEECKYIVIDFKRANYSDPAADRLIIETARGVLDQDCKLAVTYLREDSPLARLTDHFKTAPELAEVLMIDDTDEALEQFEDEMLKDHTGTSADTKFGLDTLDLFQGIPEEEIHVLESLTQAFQFDPHETIVKEGDEAQFLYIVVKGSVSIFINLPDKSRKRVSSVGPGFSFGEMALLDGGRRSADVVADEATICYGLPLAAISEMVETQPSLYARILVNLVRNLSNRLRMANDEIRALE